MKGKIKNERQRKRFRRAFTIRKKVEGSAERPRLSVFRSTKHIYAQLIDDISGCTLAAASTQTKQFDASGKKVEQAELVGRKLAEVAKTKGIEAVVFDRNGYPY